MVQGTKVGEIYDDQKLFEVVVWGHPEARDSLSAVRSIGIQTSGGGIVPLLSAADIELAPTPNEITREGGSRRIDVTCNVRGRDLGAVARDINTALGGVSFPPEYHAELLGESAARAESQTRLLTMAGFALCGIFLLLFVDFASVRAATLPVPPLESSTSHPPCASAIHRAIGRPRPAPPERESSRTNR
jgi:Cu/Ag efflux pump CusA